MKALLLGQTRKPAAGVQAPLAVTEVIRVIAATYYLG